MVNNLKAAGLFIGTVISTIFLVVVYYTLFGLCAIVARCAGFFKKSTAIGWRDAYRVSYAQKDFIKEY